MRILLLSIVLCYCTHANAQNTEVDSLKKQLAVTDDNPERVSVLEGLSYAYLSAYPDTAMLYALQGLQLAKEINSLKGEAICTNALGNVYFNIGDNAKALELYLEYLKLKEKLKERDNISVAYFNIGGVYTEEKDFNHALYYLFKAKGEDEKTKDSAAILYDVYSIGTTYLRMNRQDSALYYIDQCYRLAKKLNDENMIGAILNTYGETYLSLKNTALAAKYYNLSIPYTISIKDNEVLTSNYYGLAKIFDLKFMPDSAVIYARRSLDIAREAPFFKQVLEISTFLSNVFSKQKQFDSAFYYQTLSIATKDSLFNAESVRKVQNMKFQELQRQQTIEANNLKYRNKVRLVILISISVVLLVFAVIFWYNYRQKKKSNIILRQQKQKIKKTLKRLRLTQAQLIQSEKMASLGELIAGIAHEIQNPLNFVNNFSEINDELVNELVDEVNNGNVEQAKAIAKDIKQNLGKINHHGRRADAIVKSMLQHSGKSSGIKAPANINKLAEENLKLSYHGLRTKDKNMPAAQAGFKAELKTDFDSSIGKINIIPQDIGRALFNIFNNAFYAVNEKRKLSGSGYRPLVLIETKKLNNKIEIRVHDNGSGIPKNIIDKIFQPFFTTKPTGEGTGLGLSLAYDIITKEHNGTIKVQSKEGEGTTFIVQLPA